MFIEPYKKKVFYCDGCHRWRKVEDSINGDDCVECVYCCPDADLGKKKRKYDKPMQPKGEA